MHTSQFLRLGGALLTAGLLALSCGRQSVQAPEAGSSGNKIPRLAGTPPADPLGGRTNPLIAFIQSHWTNSDPNSTSGSIYSHIKTFGFGYKDMSEYSNGQAEADSIAAHFDVYVWGGSIVGTTGHTQNSDFLWMVEAMNTPHIRSGWDSLMTEDWIGSVENEHGYTLDDMLMHFKYDVSTWVGDTPGWNPADDPDSSGCRDEDEGNNGEPTDSTRTAQCLSDSRVLEPFYNPLRYWMYASVASPAYIEMNAERAAADYPTYQPDGFHFDAVAYAPGNYELGSTFEYDGLDENAWDFPYIMDKMYAVPAVTAAYEQVSTPLHMYLANLVSSDYTCGRPFSKDMGLLYIENAFCELWLDLNDGNNKEPVMEKRSSLLECPYVDWMENGKGMVLACKDPADSERGKLFSLATFYMVNHQLAFYYYRVSDHDIEEGEHVMDLQWNPWVEFDVGQPAVNALGFNDFQGNSNTNRFFVFQSNPSFQILGREYLRADGKRVLVLAKLMANGQTADSGGTTVTLPHTYKKLQSSDGTLSGDLTQIVMKNNTGAILIEQEGGGQGGSGGGKWHPNG